MFICSPPSDEDEAAKGKTQVENPPAADRVRMLEPAIAGRDFLSMYAERVPRYWVFGEPVRS